MNIGHLTRNLVKSDFFSKVSGTFWAKNYHCLATCNLSLLNEAKAQAIVHSPLTESRRYLPKPRKNTQYKYDYRIFEEKPYTADPINMPRLHGRDPQTGLKFNQRVEGGVKFDFYWITAYPYRPPVNGFYEERVLEVRCDPNRSPFIALVAGLRGRRWTLAAHGWEAGDIIRMNNRIPDIPLVPNEKEIWPVGALAQGTQVCMVEVLPEAQNMTELRSIAAGTSSTIMGRRGDFILLKMANQREVLLNQNCMATIGRMSNPEFGSQNWGTMNMKRRMGIKQGSGLFQRKDGYCGRKLKPAPLPMVPERRASPRPRYTFTLSVADTHAGFGTNEYNPVLKGG